MKHYTYDDTAELCRKIQEYGDQDAMGAMVQIHNGLVYSIADKFFHSGSSTLDKDDFVQVGRIGLLRAAKLYDPSIGSFSTYASWYIYSEMQRELYNKSTTVRLPVHLWNRITKINDAASKYPDCSPGELAGNIAKDIGVTEQCVTDAITAEHMFAHLSSLDVPVNATGDCFLIELVSDDDPDFVADLCNRQTIPAWIDKVFQERLTKKEREVLCRRFGFFGEEETLGQIGKSFGVGKERVRQIEAKALRKLRYKIGRYNYLLEGM